MTRFEGVQVEVRVLFVFLSVTIVSCASLRPATDIYRGVAYIFTPTSDDRLLNVWADYSFVLKSETSPSSGGDFTRKVDREIARDLACDAIRIRLMKSAVNMTKRKFTTFVADVNARRDAVDHLLQDVNSDQYLRRYEIEVVTITIRFEEPPWASHWHASQLRGAFAVNRSSDIYTFAVSERHHTAVQIGASIAPGGRIANITSGLS
jgi:hypothetical protein